jgi:large subunit ribosomal protein L1
MAGLLRTAFQASKLRCQAHPTPIINTRQRTYITRAHPTPIPTIPIQQALETLLSDMDDRHDFRKLRWESNKENRVQQRADYLSKNGKPSHPSAEEVKREAESSDYRRMDETISLALQLNLDPRKPGQSLRGSLALPHGNGKKFAVAVFTDDPALAQQALDRGAVAAGGASLIESIKNGTTSVASIQRTIATPEMMPELASVARLLGPRGLMPNPKLNTIQPKELLLDSLESQQSGISNYRTDKEGIVRIGIGKGSFGVEKLLDNVRELMNEIQGVKPDNFGKGKKGSSKGSNKGTKYYLKAHLSSTQGKKSMLVDLRTIDPTSSFFMSSPQ